MSKARPSIDDLVWVQAAAPYHERTGIVIALDHPSREALVEFDHDHSRQWRSWDLLTERLPEKAESPGMFARLVAWLRGQS
jgi:hypothetical protein